MTSQVRYKYTLYLGLKIYILKKSQNNMIKFQLDKSPHLTSSLS